MKKSIALILALVLAVGCAVVFKNCGTTQKETDQLVKYAEGLYLLSDTEPDYEAAEKALDNFSPYRRSLGSVIATADFAGYNFDYVDPDGHCYTYVVESEANNDRYASIAVAHYDFDGETNYTSGVMDGISYDALSCLLTDGINEKGVFCALLRLTDVNDVTELDNNGTNPDGKKLNFMLSVRYILDRAASAEGAVSLLKEANLYIPVCDNDYGYALFIADGEKTYVAELYNNMLVVTEDWAQLTNYCISQSTSKTAQGTERLELLQDTNEYISSRWGMMKTMKSLWYSMAYSEENEDPWYSEFYGETYTDEEGNEIVLDADADKELFTDIIAEKSAAFAEDSTNFYKNLHSSVYDFATGTLSIRNNEGALELQFSLNIPAPEPEVSEEESTEEMSE